MQDLYEIWENEENVTDRQTHTQTNKCMDIQLPNLYKNGMNSYLLNVVEKLENETWMSDMSWMLHKTYILISMVDLGILIKFLANNPGKLWGGLIDPSTPPD